MNDSKEFAAWMGRQESATILPSQWKATYNILDRLGNGDLISVLFHAESDSAFKALQMLKLRYVSEMYWMDEMNATREDADEAVDWG